MSGTEPVSTYYDVIITGAGPAGTTCALALKGAGLKVALLDKASFPRDKVCGDAIPGRAVKTLYRINPEYEARFREFRPKLSTHKTSIFYKEKNITFNWVGEAYTSTRMEFDNFLFTLASEDSDADIYTNTDIRTVTKGIDGFVIGTREGKTFRCGILVGADGANSVTAKLLADRVIDRNNHVGSVRAYYRDVTGLDPNTTEVYFEKKFLPSYMWVFPLPNGIANVGFGMLSSEIAKRKIDLKKLFHEIILQSPELQTRLSGAVQISALEGFGLPLGATNVAISGERFMLTGDAASIIDPMSGDGIGNAMLSGKLAAEQIVRCFGANNFSAAFIKSYDKALMSAIGAEMKRHRKARNVLSAAPFLLDPIFWAARNPLLKRIIQKGL